MFKNVKRVESKQDMIQMIQYYSTKQYFHFDCIVLLYVLYNTLMLVVKHEHIICHTY